MWVGEGEWGCGWEEREGVEWLGEEESEGCGWEERERVRVVVGRGRE